RLRESVFTQLSDAVVAEREQRVLVAELQAPGRAGLDAGRLEADGDAVDAERALGHLVVARRVARHVERAARLAEAAADALLRIDVDDAVLVLHDRAGRRAGRQAARVGAVHALILAQQPREAGGAGVDFAELDQ